MPVIIEMPTVSGDEAQSPSAESGPVHAAGSPQPAILITGPDGNPLSQPESVQAWDQVTAEPVIVEQPHAEVNATDGPAAWEQAQVALSPEEDQQIHQQEGSLESERRESPPVDTAPVEEGIEEQGEPTPAAVHGGRYAVEAWSPTAEAQSSPYAPAEPNGLDEASVLTRLPEVEVGSPPHVGHIPDDSAVNREADDAATASSAESTLGEIPRLPDVPATATHSHPAARPDASSDPPRDGSAATTTAPAGAQLSGAPPEPRPSPIAPPIERPEPPRRVDGLLLHATQARAHVQQGFGAANRGMLYTARQEFLQALRVVAEAKDARSGRRTHMNALAEGLTAVEEAEQIRSVSSAITDTDLSLWVATHKTPAMHGENVSGMLPLAIIDKYHEYAGRQLGAAVAGDPSGSMALYGLARIYEHLGSENGADRVARSRQSVALHEAALMAHPENHLAAHELGVVFTKLGRAERAVAMLTRSVQLSPTSTAYHNLAVASRQLGRHRQAGQAERYAAQMAEHERAAGGSPTRVAWLDPMAFARTSDPTAAARPAAASHEASGPQTVAAQEERRANQESSWWKLPAWR